MGRLKTAGIWIFHHIPEVIPVIVEPDQNACFESENLGNGEWHLSMIEKRAMKPLICNVS